MHPARIGDDKGMRYQMRILIAHSLGAEDQSDTVQ
jgi:hypothetical protein